MELIRVNDKYFFWGMQATQAELIALAYYWRDLQ
jgi:hypothetical protein